MEEKDYALSDQMTDYLTNFVKSGDPNGDGLPRWEANAAESKAVLCVGEGETVTRRAPILKMIYNMLSNKAVGE